jgi:hypothetical protein
MLERNLPVRLSRKARTSFRALLALTAALALAGAATTASVAGETGQTVIAQNGFGEHENSYAWSMGWFKGKLYVGTGRDVLCVENETTQFFVPLEHKYTLDPELNVHCPANPFDMDLRAEIWQYTPQAKKWKRVEQSPTETNPSAPTLQVARDMAYRGMTVYKHDGKEALFAAGVSPDEYIPPLLTSHPPRILRSFDGVHWQSLNLPSQFVNYPEGRTRAMGFRAILEWKEHLYVTATPDLTGNGSLFEVTNPFSDHARLVQVTPPNLNVFEAVEFDGNLYVGCGSEKSGYSVWEASGEHQPFVPIVTGGAGRGAEVTSVVSMHVFHGALYVGASGWYQNTLPQSEMIRIVPNGGWTLVVGDPRKLPNGQTTYPTSGLVDGFNSLFNAHFWRMGVFGGGLYVGTNSWAELVKNYKGRGWLEDLLVGAEGYQVWATCEGEDWYPVTRGAFGYGEYNFGGRTFEANPNGKEMFIGSANHAQGTMILDDHESICSSLVHTASTVAKPGAMIAEAADNGKGTLLSWKPSPSAARYEVLAAPETSIKVYMQPQPVRPQGFNYEGAEPILASPGTAGAVPVSLSLPGEFEPVGTTSSAFFLAHTSAHRIYEVVAMNARGDRSEPSNIQIVPTPEPAATFGSLQGVLGSSVIGSSSSARAASVSGPRALLDEAQAAWAQGERQTALLDVQRLQAGAGTQHTELAALAARLERRLLYASAAGEP